MNPFLEKQEATGQYGLKSLSDLATHKHTGLDAKQIDPKDLLGFPIYTAVPTHSAPEGTLVLRWDGSTTYELYARINKAWRKCSLS